MHIPSATIKKSGYMTFGDALKEENESEHGYDAKKWLYVPCHYDEYRYVLGTRGKNPLICIGINPSTAVPGNLDNTMKSVERISGFNGYDSFIMFNVYPQRATNPDAMDKEPDEGIFRENLSAFRYILSHYGEGKSPAVWAAWGAIIEKRPYLKGFVRRMIDCGNEYGAKWYTVGSRSKQKGHPHHPLYLKNTAVTEPFSDIAEYLDKI